MGRWPLPTVSDQTRRQSWGDTQHNSSHTIWESLGTSLRGFPDVTNGKSWVSCSIRDGQDHGFEQPNGFGLKHPRHILSLSALEVRWGYSHNRESCCK